MLNTSVQFLKGIGEKRAESLKEVGVRTVLDLLYYFPRRYLDRSHITRIKDLREDLTTTIVGQVRLCGIAGGRKKRFVLSLQDDTGVLNCVWFNRVQYWSRIFTRGETLAVSGKVSHFGNYQIVHPDFDRLSDNGDSNFQNTGRIIPLYPSSDTLSRVGLDSRGFRRVQREALAGSVQELQETLPESLRKRQELVDLRTAISSIHFPESKMDLVAARTRLKFDELFYLELMLAYRKRSVEGANKGIEFRKVGARTRDLIASLPYELTSAQKKVLHEIRADMKQESPMNRLLQGDVGSGKTVVALVTMLMAIENGFQSALMAPTEILAEQHYLTMTEMLQGLNVAVVLLVGSQKKAEREAVLESIRSGQADVVVGTHALIQGKVDYKNLGLTVIDEQHRFGVMQRAALIEKGRTPDVLVMTATPIPRTLSMTLYGDLDVSIIDELPPGRKPIKTYWRSDKKRNEIYRFVREQVEQGEQAYIIFPLIEESEKIDLQAAVENFETMRQDVFARRTVGLLHGRMKSDEKETVMREFKNGNIDVLVSTTVIEVGVNVPNATVMVIENAERFGLPQLHQLRGRVGRGQQESYCFLVAHYPISAEGKVRLDTLTTTNDGFKIAEVDLKLRGPGEFFGTKQSGLPELKIADIVKDTELLIRAREEAFALASQDKQILDFENTTVRTHFFKKYRDKFELAKVG